ncbi:invasion associated locus B family protein [Pseudohoeflea suaedae]|uniref:invasion associated locus B family protein n=1 Tax=Pseudohoeflea suaedae TaxID=877384 RepID=UPI001304CBAF|nr:invasion associated locus B family protein [Pseudohoeflea suaedae]
MSAGAPVLQESYGDWGVICTNKDKATLCLMRQEQRTKNTHEIVLAAELRRNWTGDMILTLTMPFGVRLADGVTMQVDDGKLSKTMAFSTCLLVGCLSVFEIDGELETKLRNGKVLNLAVTRFEDGRSFTLPISLNGFAPASDRLGQLVGAKPDN